MSWFAEGSPFLWYLNRSTGLVVLGLLTLVTVLGVMSTARRVPAWWARFATVELHRRAALLAVALLVLHIATAVADEYVDIAWLDAFVPFRAGYRPLWLGLGTVAFDLWLAVVVTSLFRRRLSLLAWKAVHYLAYLAWVPAVLHGLGSGTDAKALPVLVLTFGSVAAVVAAAAWRVAVSSLPLVSRLALGLAVVAVPVVIAGATP
jgi:sulfoxide reductase heme-binding subunit YedZ